MRRQSMCSLQAMVVEIGFDTAHGEWKLPPRIGPTRLTVDLAICESASRIVDVGPATRNLNQIVDLAEEFGSARCPSAQ